MNDGQRKDGHMDSNKENLSKRQLAVMEDLFGGQLDEPAVLEKHKVSRRLYNKWQACENFAAQYGRRIAVLNLQSERIIARYGGLAAAKLVELTESENPETARKACMDIISLASSQSAKYELAAKEAEQAKRAETIDANSRIPPEPKPLPHHIAAKLLAALADDDGQEEQDELLDAEPVESNGGGQFSDIMANSGH